MSEREKQRQRTREKDREKRKTERGKGERESHKRLKNHRIKSLCLPVTLYKYTIMNLKIYRYCLHMTETDSPHYCISQVHSISHQNIMWHRGGSIFSHHKHRPYTSAH